MNPLYNRKLHQCLIDTGKKVERREHKETPSMNDLQELYDDFVDAVDDGDMKAQSVASRELIAALVKWRVEKL